MKRKIVLVNEDTTDNIIQYCIHHLTEVGIEKEQIEISTNIEEVLNDINNVEVICTPEIYSISKNPKKWVKYFGQIFEANVRLITASAPAGSISEDTQRRLYYSFYDFLSGFYKK